MHVYVDYSLIKILKNKSEIGRITVRSQLRQKVTEITSQLTS
jgi:hypothetical protein